MKTGSQSAGNEDIRDLVERVLVWQRELTQLLGDLLEALTAPDGMAGVFGNQVEQGEGGAPNMRGRKDLRLVPKPTEGRARKGARNRTRGGATTRPAGQSD